MSGALGDVLVASGAQARGLTISLVGSSPGVGPASLCFYNVAVFSGDTIDMRPAPAFGQSPPFSVTTLWLYPPPHSLLKSRMARPTATTSTRRIRARRLRLYFNWRRFHRRPWVS
jgi:hypothetical protein